MSEETLILETQELNRWQQHKFMILVALTIAMSLLLVAISLWLYNSSGAAQLDLSRPGYESARSQVSSHTNIESFEADGPLDEDALKKFRNLYENQLKEATAVDAFGREVMSDEMLGIGASAAE